MRNFPEEIPFDGESNKLPLNPDYKPRTGLSFFFNQDVSPRKGNIQTSPWDFSEEMSFDGERDKLPLNPDYKPRTGLSFFFNQDFSPRNGKNTSYLK